MRELFADWSHMTLKESVLKTALAQVTQRYERHIAGYGGPTDMHDAGAMVLVDQTCWFKLTYVFGLLGPEIMLHAALEKMLGAYIPDLEPIKVHVH